MKCCEYGPWPREYIRYGMNFVTLIYIDSYTLIEIGAQLVTIVSWIKIHFSIETGFSF
jgi:hypothetical protein